MKFFLPGKLEIKLDIPFLVCLQMNCLMFTANTKLKKIFGMQCIKNVF